ncbi:Ig-like domain-containing protein [Candidatus Epulonipiscium viviparus]|uniref:Ig-like domain-containing protein n=1 Tax=Candidatus Epulonipiscium viviparus TaxID=420336 RepID=UPI002738139C|nr:Ig-like domain-containing protein [Candidatus Epulopiscium viviparus]
MKFAMQLAILAVAAFTAVPVLAVSQSDIDNHSFGKVSFEDDDKQTLKITTSSPPWGFSEYSIEEFMPTDGKNALKTRYEAGNSSTIRIAPADGGTWDFSDSRMVLAFDFTNTNDHAQRITTIFRHSGGTTAYMNEVPANTTNTMYCILDQDKIQLGADVLPSPVAGVNGIVLSNGWGNMNFDKSTVTAIDLSWSLGGDVGYYTFDNFRIVENPLLDVSTAYAGIIDKYGQYAPKTWPNKIFSDEQLKEAQAAEEAQVAIWKAEQEARTDRTIYGGYKNEALRQEATGHFYTTKINDIWTLIDPEGYPFFSTGFGIVRKNGKDTWVDGREYMFQELPAKNGEFGDHYGKASGLQPPFGKKTGTSFSFYSMNLEKKYGDDWLQDWGKMATDRFEAWGITSLGAWAEPDLFFGKGSIHKTPYTAFTWTTVASGKHVRLYDSVPDAFDPEFEKSTIAAIKDQAVRYGIHEDPYCFGVYVDNEYNWGNNMSNNALVKAIFDDDVASEKSYAKRHFVAVLEDKYGSISALNSAWGSNLSSFAELGKPYTGKIAAEDASMVVSQLADQYYKTVDSVIAELLPGTMYLGSRNTEWGTPIEVIHSAIKYVDVLSFNNYNVDVHRENFKFEEYDMPMIIGEFGFGASDAGHFSATGTSLPSQQARGDAYINYVESALKSGKFIGTHWFQYYDEPILGRSWDGENFNAGFIDVTDQPYPELVDAARYIYDTMYETMFNHIPMTNIHNTQSSIALAAGETATIETLTTPANLNEDVSYYSTNLYVATVDENGVVTAVGDGDATIVTKNANDLFVVTSTNVVVGDGAAPASVRFTAKELTMIPGTTLNLKDQLKLDNATNLKWKTSKKAIATVDENGILTAHAPGRISVVVEDKNSFATDSISIVVQSK